MLSFDERQSSNSSSKQIPGFVDQLSPVEQIPFPDSSPLAGKTTDHLQQVSSQNATQPLSDPRTMQDLAGYITSPRVTHILPNINTGELSFPSTRTTTALRQPIVIRGSLKKKHHVIHVPKGHKWIISIAAIALLLFISLGTAFAASPLNGGSGHLPNPIQLVANLVHNSNNSPSLIAQQATATAVLQQDGINPGSGLGMGVITQPGAGGLNRFAFGQCTYWANMRYHALTGYWVPWLGNAYQWAYGASASGWIVSSKPIVPSIIVLQPGVQGAGSLGHVAIVERINPDGSVYTSDYNWYANGGWDILSYVTFYPGSGVSFVWHP
ncbi:MAG TPA: CHAP domain-containing protein [Ktedonobacteraceae bacterium]|nr:CHAP domain-containing protein [Ktedonobacteraceae bacterium]